MIADIKNVYLRRAAVIAFAAPGAVFLYVAMTVCSLIEAGKAFAYEWKINDAPSYWSALRSCWTGR